MDLSRKRERDRLAVRREPYWHRLDKGFALGFRKGADTWIVRKTNGDGSKVTHSLSDLHLEFDQAKRKAEDWLEAITGAPVRKFKRGTVRVALEAYLADLMKHNRASAAKDAEWRFKKYVYSDALADLKLERATRDDFAEWRERQRPGRLDRTVNRQVRSVVAALNRATELGHVGNPLAWKLKKLVDDTEDTNETAIFLTLEERKALLAATDQSTADLLRDMDFTGARPHELAAAVVSDFDGVSIRLAHRTGRPPKLRVRHVTLSQEGIEFFARMVAGKLRTARIFRPERLASDNNRDPKEDDVREWTSHLWGRRVRAAIDRHNETAQEGELKIPVDASAYSFRHARISELLQIHNIDPVTVAAQTGTSILMLEKTYFKFIHSAMRAKLAAVKAGGG
jgi:integrase